MIFRSRFRFHFRSALLQRRTAVAGSLALLMAMSAAHVSPAQDAPQEPSSPIPSGPVTEQDPPSISLPQEAEIAPNEKDSDGETMGVLPADRERVRRRILDALQGGGPGASTSGDPILDDVIGIIRAQGSVLDGTVLDSDALDSGAPQDPPGRSLEETTRRGEAPRDATPLLGRTVDGVTLTDVSEQRFRAAESLLRTARLLSALPDPDGHRQSLVRQLRAEAGRCLIGP